MIRLFLSNFDYYCYVFYRSHSTFVKRRNIPAFTYRRLIVIGILVFLALCTLVHYFLKFGRESAEHDPMLDPRFNPNIRNEDIQS
jgi:hypothetical protein